MEKDIEKGRPVFSVYERENGEVYAEKAPANDAASVIWSFVKLMRSRDAEVTMIVTSALIHLLSLMPKKAADDTMRTFRGMVDRRRKEIMESENKERIKYILKSC